ncbi:MAG: hypothetical protein ACLQU3_23270 [Limisphaerales bacterium]
MKKLQLLTAAVLLASIWATHAQNVPALINYQGQLVDGTGTPLPNGNYELTFRIYSADPGGSLLWGPQVLPSVALVGGRFNVVLGPTDAGGQAVTAAFSNAVAYLEIQVGANSPISPRQQVLSAPYALQAENSEFLAGYGWDAVFTDTGRPDTGHLPGAKIADESITSSQIGPGAITTSQLASEAVTAANIAPAAVGAAQIANGAVGTQQIANGAVGTAQIASGAVGTDQIAIGAVGTDQIATNAVGTDQIAPGSINGSLIGWPLYVSGGYAHNLRIGGQTPGVLEITNTYVGGGLGLLYADYCISVAGEFCIAAVNQSGQSAYIADDGDAADFYGPVNVSGTLTKSGGSFKIDHPLDPANKYLSHSFVESPDMKNVYDGVVTLDARGEATVSLPEWFEALNKDFRYQLTAIGAPQPNLYIAAEVSGNSFKISGGAGGGKVSWQVTGIRHDAWANAHRIPVEGTKPEAERGFYLAPELFGQSQEKNVRLARHASAKPAQH